MFRWLNKQGVESDDGFAVQVLDRFNLEYRESSGQTLTAKMEIGFTSTMKPCVILDRRSLKRWDDEGGDLAESEIERVERHLAEAMHFQGMEIEFV